MITARTSRETKSYGRRAAASVVGLLALGLLATGCSSPEKEYATPSSLCDVSVPPDLLDPFLPAGKKLSSVPKNDVQGITRCRLVVDEKTVVSASTEWYEKTLREVAGAPYNEVELDSTTTPDKRYIYAVKGGIGLVDCQDPKRPDQRLIASVRVTQGAKDETRMKELITAFTEGVAGSAECERRRLG
ncbi:hypothetical protein [Streptomyces sp. SID3212]|uniref:hypothetical protein n=1 Tax=Streptomyces sp. SID3212 TaxID=2690259 RepID=UPI00136881B6|nr:hypothetical protein [Streptomyces sp. SID3212]MYV57969.1 hypothetical protein [Streptomyces sp. SID3212]